MLGCPRLRPHSASKACMYMPHQAIQQIQELCREAIHMWVCKTRQPVAFPSLILETGIRTESKVSLGGGAAEFGDL